MDNDQSPPPPNSTKDLRKTFAQQAGISFDLLHDLEFAPPKRQTRHRNQPIPPNHIHSQFHTSPTVSTKHQTTAPPTPATPKKQTKTTTQSTPKQSRTPETKQQKKDFIASIPKSVDEFFQNYSTFSTRLFSGPESEKQAKFIDHHKHQLFELLSVAISQGGIVKIISQGLKNVIFHPFLNRFNVQTSEEIFRLYKHYLLHFEYHILENYTFKQYHNAVPLLREAVFIDEQELSSFLAKSPLDPKYFDNDITVFRNGQNAIGIDSNTIHLDRVADHYKDYSIDIRIQKAMDYGFKPRTMRNEPYQMKIGNYRIYQKLCEEYALTQTSIDPAFIERLGQLKNLDVNGTPFKDRVSSEEIFFGVNFDPDDGLLFDYINERVDGTFLGYKQEFDLLSYMDQEVPGCSFPQFYFKVRGVWTGGHQENINMCSVNINHGPDASEWYSMEFKYVEEFRAQLKKEHKMDLYGSEGLWYEKINWFMEQGKYPVKKIIQQKGDIVVSGPGTLHWVRSHGVALQSAWNQFPITYRMMEYAFCRQEENQRISFIRSNTIPLKMLTLKLLNHQSPQLTSEVKNLCVGKVRMWIKKEEEIFEEIYQEWEDFDFGLPRYEKLEDLQGFCKKCRQEILIYFANGKKVEDILCLSCYKKEYKNQKKTKRLYVRNNLFDLNLLLKKSETGQPFKEIKAFCGNYVGRVPFDCAQNKCKVEKQSLLFQKINIMNQELNSCDSKKAAEFKNKLKDKRSEAEEKDQQIQLIAQRTEQMDVESVKKLQKCEPSNIAEQKSQERNFKIQNNIKYFGNRPSSSGWWDFQIPQEFRIVTQQNHSELLKLIQTEQFAVRDQLFRKNLPKISYPYFVFKSSNHERRERPASNPANNIKFCDDPKFSSDQEDFKDTIKKKVHKNEDFDEKSKNRKERIRSSSKESRSSKKNRKHKKSRSSGSSRSKSQQKSKKQKKSRSKSQQSRRQQSSKYVQKKQQPSEKRRSKSRGKSSHKSSNRIEEQVFSRKRQASGDIRNDLRNNDGRGDRNNNRDNYERYQQRNRNDYNNEKNYREYRYSDNHNGYSGKDKRNFDRSDNRERGYDGGRQHNRKDQGSSYYNDKRSDYREGARPYNNQYNSTQSARPQYQRNDSRQDDYRNASKDQSKNKIIEENHDDNNIDY